MRKILAIASIIFGTLASVALADEATKPTNTQMGTVSAQPIKAMELSDAQMDKVSAGVVAVATTAAAAAQANTQGVIVNNQCQTLLALVC